MQVLRCSTRAVVLVERNTRIDGRKTGRAYCIVTTPASIYIYILTVAWLGGCHAFATFRASSVTTQRRNQQPPPPLLFATPPLQAILWDMDGVLADTERDGHRVAFNQAFAEYNLDTEWDEDTYGSLLHVGGGKERMTAHWNQVGWPDAIGQSSSSSENRKDVVKELHLRKTDIFMQMINTGVVPLRPGVLRVMDEAIAAGVQLAVCSTSDVAAVTNLVTTLLGPERATKFQIFAGDMVARKKPAPDVYNMAVENMGLDRDRCVIVEDSGIGWGAAKAAGIRCIVTMSSYTRDEDFTGADWIVDELGDDPAIGVTLATLQGLLKTPTKL
jgi:HAD superfamily hydrolase (TIGR01509 family)